MTGPTPGKYHIVSVATNKPTGIGFFTGGPTPPEQTVHLDDTVNVWTLTRDIPDHPRVYLFALEPDYPWSGVNDLEAQTKRVTAFTQPGPRAVHWYVKPGEEEGTYTIAWDHIHDQLWTVEFPSNPMSDIVLKEPGHGAFQLFRFEPAK